MASETLRATLRPLPPRTVVRVVFRDRSGDSPEAETTWHGWVYEPRRSRKHGQFWPVDYRFLRDGWPYTAESQLPPHNVDIEVLEVTPLPAMPASLLQRPAADPPARTGGAPRATLADAPAETTPKRRIEK